MQNVYRLRDRLTEISSHMGVLLVAIATYLGYHVSADDPMRFATPVLQILGSFGIAIPEQKATQTTEQVVQMVLKAIDEQKKAAAAALLFFVLIFAGALAACTGNAQQDAANAQAYLTAFQPVESTLACQLQASANASGAGFSASGNPAAASGAAAFSTAVGSFCNGKPAGAPLEQPVTITVHVVSDQTVPVAPPTK